MRLMGSRAYATPVPTPTMPPGLVEVMEGLAKDVLKNNPENIYEFCAAHMQKLIEIRDGPSPKSKQLSLEQKIAKAQERIQQRIKNRQLQYDRSLTEHPTENLVHNEIQFIKEIPISTTAAQPVIHEEDLTIQKEVEIFHEPNVTIASNDTSADKVPHEVTEIIETPQLVLEIKEDGHKHESGESAEINTEVLEKNIISVETGEKTDVDITHEPENIAVVAEQTKEAQDLAREKTDVAITHKPEHIAVVAEQTKEAQDLAREKTDVGITHKPEHIAVVAEQTKEAQDLHKESTAHVEMISTYGDNIEAKLIETEPSAGDKGNAFEEKTNNLNGEAPGKQIVEDDLNGVASTLLLASETVAALSNKSEVTPLEKEVADEQKLEIKEEKKVSDIGNTLAEKTDDFNNEAQEKDVVGNELNVVASTLLLASKTVAAFSNKSDITTTEKVVVEEPKLEKTEEKIDTPHEDVLIKKIAYDTEPEKVVDDVVNEQKIIYEEEDKEKNANHIQSIKSIKATAGNITVEQNDDNLLPKSENTTVEEIGDRKIETSPLPHSSQDEVPVLPSTDTETKEKHNSMEDSDLSDNQIITVEATQKSNIESFQNEDSSDNQVILWGQEYELNNKELPSQAHSENIIVKNNDAQGGITVEYDKDTMAEREATTENTAVNGMDLETAAITIQKVFRTFLFSKSRASTLEDTVNENSLDEDIEKKVGPEYLSTSANLNKERRTLGISRMDTVLQTVNEEKSLSLSDDSSLSSAATTIQAHVRGFLVRNRLASNKTASSSSLVNSDGPSTSLDGDVNEPKKTILNIHIVPERGQFMSRDESLLTSIDLPLDNSPPSSINLHPLGYDKSERRKQLKREDAIQSISPPSNNSGKLSEEVDSVKEALNDNDDLKQEQESVAVNNQDKPHEGDTESCDTTLTISSTAETVVEAETYNARENLSSPEHNPESEDKSHEVVTSSDEMDVVTPSTITAKTNSVDTEDNDKPKLVHSGELHDIVVQTQHDIVVQTQVKRSEASVVRGE